MEGRERDSAAGMIRLRFHLYVVDCTPLVWQFLGQPQTNTDELSCDEHRTQMKIKAMSAELFFFNLFLQQRNAQFSLSMNGILLH